MESLNDHLEHIPHAHALGMNVVRHDESGCVVRVPYAEHLVGDPDTGVVHGGVLTALLDNTCGIAVRPGPDESMALATLDLRIDYMGPAEPHKDILAEAVCYKRTRHVAFVRATAYQTSADQPVATCVATFMLGTSAPGATRQADNDPGVTPVPPLEPSHGSAPEGGAP